MDWNRAAEQRLRKALEADEVVTIHRRTPGQDIDVQGDIEDALAEMDSLRARLVEMYERIIPEEIAKGCAQAERDAQVQREENREWRKFAWLLHGHSIPYVDDGEMQCGLFDYKRQPAERLIEHSTAAIQELGQAQREREEQAEAALLDRRQGYDAPVPGLAEARQRIATLEAALRGIEWQAGSSPCAEVLASIKQRAAAALAARPAQESEGQR